MKSRLVVIGGLASVVLAMLAVMAINTRVVQRSEQTPYKGQTMVQPHPLVPPTAAVPHSNLRTRFDSNIENSDANSMLIIAEVTEECAPIGHFKSWEDYAAADPLVQSGQMPQEMQDELKAMFDRLTPDCVSVNAKLPKDSQFSDWSWDWYKKAAADGNVVARLRIISSDPSSEDNRLSMATLLNDSMVDSNDYRLDYLAADFLINYPIDDDNLRSAHWRYVGCMHDPECDVSIMKKELSEHYLPAQVDEIIQVTKQKTDFLSVSAFSKREGD